MRRMPGPFEGAPSCIRKTFEMLSATAARRCTAASGTPHISHLRTRSCGHFTENRKLALAQIFHRPGRKTSARAARKL